MNESKCLKSVLACNEQIDQLDSNLSKQNLRCHQKINEWMQMQHNVCLRQLSPYFNQLNLERQEMCDRQHASTNKSIAKIFESLKDDEEQFSESKSYVDNQLYSSSGSFTSSFECHHADLNGCKMPQDVELRKLVARMNSNFVAKEIKKIIRFKFGYMQIVDDEIRTLKMQLEHLEAEKKLLSIIPEVYDKESLHHNKFSIENKARDIVNECRAVQGANGERPRRSPDGAVSPICQDNHQDLQGGELYESCGYNFDDEDPGNADFQMKRRKGCLDYNGGNDLCCNCAPMVCVRRSSTFMDISDELESNDSMHDSSLESRSIHASCINNACSSIARRMSDMKIDNIANLRTKHNKQADFGDAVIEVEACRPDSVSKDAANRRNLTADNILINTLDASDIYNAQKKYLFAPNN